MQKLTQYEINLIIEFAPKTLDLSYFDLRGVDLRGVDLRGAVLIGVDLRGVDLERANLERANLERANLRGAYLERAILREANLERANLERAILIGANLRGANLERAILRGAYLEWANLERAILREANLEGANLEGAKIDYQIEEGLIQKIRDIVFHNNKNLFMSSWHYGCDDAICGTAHCIAGWACELGKNGKELEEKYGSGIASLLILGHEAYSHFFDNKEKAIEWLKTQ